MALMAVDRQDTLSFGPELVYSGLSFFLLKLNRRIGGDHENDTLRVPLLQMAAPLSVSVNA